MLAPKAGRVGRRLSPGVALRHRANRLRHSIEPSGANTVYFRLVFLRGARAAALKTVSIIFLLARNWHSSFGKRKTEKGQPQPQWVHAPPFPQQSARRTRAQMCGLLSLLSLHEGGYVPPGSAVRGNLRDVNGQKGWTLLRGAASPGLSREGRGQSAWWH